MLAKTSGEIEMRAAMAAVFQNAQNQTIIRLRKLCLRSSNWSLRYNTF